MAKILIFSPTIIGQSMAGPAIRSWEFAKALSGEHQVSLIAPHALDPKTTPEGQGFAILSKDHPTYAKTFKEANILIAQHLNFLVALRAKRAGIKIIIDAYDPVPLELLEQFKQHPLKVRHTHHSSSISSLIFNFQMADGIICASEKQRDLWIGFLLSQKHLSPLSYDQDTSFRHLIDVVPFGLSSSLPQKTGPGLREKYGFSQQDKILLWGGGIWNWFDPLSLIRAMKLLHQSRQDIKLVFMGIKNPDPTSFDMTMCREAIQLATQLDLIDRTVFFNHGWVPYAERQNSLLDATLGVSTHFDHLETNYSFRTRLLDYLWAHLPILATMGDSFAEMIKHHQMGCVVPYRDEKSIADAILSLVDDPQKIEAIKANIHQVRPQFYWETVIKPLQQMIARLAQQPIQTLGMKDIQAVIRLMLVKIPAKLGVTKG